MLELLDGQLQYLVTECSLPQLLYYNEHYDENICDVAKTRQQILEWYKQHNNVNIVVERSDRKYLHTGRFQDEEAARGIDRAIRATLVKEHIAYTVLKADIDLINRFASALV